MTQPALFRVDVPRLATRAEMLARLHRAGHMIDEAGSIYMGRSCVYLDDIENIRHRPSVVEMSLPTYVPGLTADEFEGRLSGERRRFADLWEAISLAVDHPEIFDPFAPDPSALVMFGAPFQFYSKQVCVLGFGGLSDKPMLAQYRRDLRWGRVRVFAVKL